MNIIRNRDEFVDALRLGVDGEVLTSGADYDDARTPHFPVRIGHPLAVVRPKHLEDLAAAVDAARLTGLPLFVRSGAHHGAGHSSGDGLLVDLRSLDNIDIDMADRTAWVDTRAHSQTGRLGARAVRACGWVRRYRQRWHWRAYARRRNRLPESSVRDDD